MKKGREFELIYKKLYDLDKVKYDVQSPAYLEDKITKIKREVDLLIIYKDANNQKTKISVECRDRNSTQDVTWIEQLIQKKNDLDIDFTIAVTTSSFTEPAIIKAKAYGIKIEIAEKIDSDYINKMTNINICNFVFLYTKAIDIEFKTDKGLIIHKTKLLKDNKGFIVKNGRNEITSAKKLIESYLNNDLYKTITLVDQIKDKTINDNVFSKKEYKITIQKKIDSNQIIIKNAYNNITELIVSLQIIPFKYSVPLTGGLIINKLGDNENNKDFFTAYDGKIISASPGSIEQNYYLPIKFGNNKDRYGRFISMQYRIITSMKMHNGDRFLLSFQSSNGSVIDNIMGELDCSELWK